MKSKTFSGQTPEARKRANENSQTVRVANDRARVRNSDIDWDAQIASLRKYFKTRDRGRHA